MFSKGPSRPVNGIWRTFSRKILVLTILAFTGRLFLGNQQLLVLIAQNEPDIQEVFQSKLRSHASLKPEGLVWLMSFPNSGTSYTLSNYVVSSECAIATNYRPEARKGVVRVFPNETSSPYFVNPIYKPSRLVFTKTHCGGFCESCAPLGSVKEFQDSCATLTNNGRPEPGGLYDTALVKRAVHLFRSPFDNIVARMHLGMKRRTRQQTRNVYEDTPAGLTKWCRFVDQRFQGNMTEIMLQRGIAPALYDGLPCSTEFYRYVQWHNYALEVTERMNLSTLHIFYEDYTVRFNETVETLFEFLEVPAATKVKPFIPGKTYEGVFDEAAARSAAAFVKALASSKCWDLVQHYFQTGNPHLNGNETAISQIGRVSNLRRQDQQRKVVWLLSYPNSGTSYTMHAVLRTTNLSTATNHGQEVDRVGRFAVRPDVADSPFLLMPGLATPRLVLTKTHCSGYCFDCAPVRSTEEFMAACRSGTYSDKGRIQKALYPTTLVGKAVHIIRSPYDGLVSRMRHSLYSKRTPIFTEENRKIFSSASGLLPWCQNMDERFRLSMMSNVSEFAAWLQVPCYSLIIRYTLWHNAAVDTVRRLDLPVLVVHYENYTSNFESTVGGILDFLELKARHPPPPFESGKTYRDMFADSHARDLAGIVWSLATEETRSLVGHYLHPFLRGLATPILPTSPGR